jgi:hypothetical protein
MDIWGRIAPTRRVPMSNATDAESLDICPRVAGVNTGKVFV